MLSTSTESLKQHLHAAIIDSTKLIQLEQEINT